MKTHPDQHPKLGGLILALSDERQSTTAWDTGAAGEERLGKGLDRLASDTVRLLHDRRIPNNRSNIDHLAVTASGVSVIDAMKKSSAELKAIVLARGSRLMDLRGVGPVVAARTLADVGDVARFADRNRFASP